MSLPAGPPPPFQDLVAAVPSVEELPVGGRLRKFLEAWDSLGDAFASSVIRSGVRIEFEEAPHQERLHKIPLDASDEVIAWQETVALLSKRAIRRLPSCRRARRRARFYRRSSACPSGPSASGLASTCAA